MAEYTGQRETLLSSPEIGMPIHVHPTSHERSKLGERTKNYLACRAYATERVMGECCEHPHCCVVLCVRLHNTRLRHRGPALAQQMWGTDSRGE